MSLQACPECAKEISRKAAACPHCGTPLTRAPIVTGGTVVQCVILALAVGLAWPLVKQEFFSSGDRTDGVTEPSVLGFAWSEIKERFFPSSTRTDGAVADPGASVKRKARTTAKKAARPNLECGSAEIEAGVAEAWRDEVARALSSQRGIELESARQAAARMKLNLWDFETQESAPGAVQCTALVSVTEGDGFQSSTNEVAYRAERIGRDRAVTLIYAPVPPL